MDAAYLLGKYCGFDIQTNMSFATVGPKGPTSPVRKLFPEIGQNVPLRGALL